MGASPRRERESGGKAGARRPPRDRGSPAREASPDKPCRIGAVVLAAGRSRRMGGGNKLLLEVEGVPVVVRAVEAVLAALNTVPVVVTGYEADRVRAALSGRRLRFVHNPDFDEGLATSLRVGVAALPRSADAAFVCLGDMPCVTPAHLCRLISAFDPRERAICVPVRRGRRGNPVLWARRFFPEMRSIEGDVGARGLIGRHSGLVCEVEMDGDGVLVDLDTPDDLARLEDTLRKGAARAVRRRGRGS